MNKAIETGITFRKTRIAPTPSGYLHLGNVLSFAITAALAKKTNAKIFLRIDDLDRPRIHKEYVQDIFDTLHFMNIPWDEGPKDYREYETQYSQLHRVELYKAALQKLKESGDLFACTCSRTNLQVQTGDVTYHGSCQDHHIPFDTEHASWRLDTSAAKQLTVKTLQGSVISLLPGDINHFVVRRKDRVPGYQLTSVIDDVYFGIDLVVRGQDLWQSTLAQLYMADVLKQETFLNTTFHHHALLTGLTGEKLSKSAGATSVQYLRSQGKTTADIYTMIAAMHGIQLRVTNFLQLAELLMQPQVPSKS